MRQRSVARLTRWHPPHATSAALARVIRELAAQADFGSLLRA
jgi:hypothetical protein